MPAMPQTPRRLTPQRRRRRPRLTLALCTALFGVCFTPQTPRVAADPDARPWMMQSSATVEKNNGERFTVHLQYDPIDEQFRFLASEPIAEAFLQTAETSLQLTDTSPDVWRPAPDWEGETTLTAVSRDGARAVVAMPLTSLFVSSVEVNPKQPLPGDALEVTYTLSRTPPPMPADTRLYLLVELVKAPNPDPVAAISVPLTTRRGGVSLPMPAFDPYRPMSFDVRAGIRILPPPVFQLVVGRPWRMANMEDANGERFSVLVKNHGEAPPETTIVFNPTMLETPPPGQAPPENGPHAEIAPVNIFFRDERLGPGVHQKYVLHVPDGQPNDMVIIRCENRITHATRLARLHRRHPSQNAESLPPNHYFLDWCWFGSVQPTDRVTVSVMRQTDTEGEETAVGHTVEIPYEQLPAAARYAAQYLPYGRIPLHNQTAQPSDPLTFGGVRYVTPERSEAVPGVYGLRTEQSIDANHVRLSWRANLIDYPNQNDETTRLRSDETLAPEAFVCHGGTFVAPPAWEGDRWTAVVEFSPTTGSQNGVEAGHADVRIALNNTENGAPVRFAAPHAEARWVRDYNQNRSVRIEIDETPGLPFGVLKGRVWTAPHIPAEAQLTIEGQVCAHQPGRWTPFTVSVAGENRDNAPYTSAKTVSAVLTTQNGTEITQSSCETPNFRPNSPYVAPQNRQYYQMLPEHLFAQGQFPLNRYVFRRYFPFGKRSSAQHYLCVVNSFQTPPWETGNPFPYFTLAVPNGQSGLAPAQASGGWHFASAAYAQPYRGFVYWANAARAAAPNGPIQHYYLPVIEEDEDPAHIRDGCPELTAAVTAEPMIVPANQHSQVVVRVEGRAFDFGCIEGGDQPITFETGGDYVVPIGPGVNPRRLRVRLVRENCATTDADILIERQTYQPRRLVIDAPQNHPEIGDNRNGRYWTGDDFQTGKNHLRTLAQNYQRMYGAQTPAQTPLPERTGFIHLTNRPTGGVRQTTSP